MHESEMHASKTCMILFLFLHMENLLNARKATNMYLVDHV